MADTVSPPASPRDAVSLERSGPLYGSTTGGLRSGDQGPRLTPRGSSDEEHEFEQPAEYCPSGCSRESVYRFIVVWPALNRIKRGSYWSCDVCISILVLVFIAIFQVCIVLVAGGHIVAQSRLVYHTSVQSSMEQSVLPAPFDKLVGHLPNRPRRAVESVFGEKLGQECCHDASCFDKLPCCMPNGSHVNHNRLRELQPPRFDSLCFEDAGDLDCAEASFQLVGRWSQVDVDGDEHWSHEEAVADGSNLGCRLQVDLAELFRAVCMGIIADSKLKHELGVGRVKVPHEVARMHAVPHAHFAQWEGMAVLCAVMDPTRCGALVAQGVFDGALGLNGGRRWTLAKAVEYCGRLLVPGGVCDATLPVHYAADRQKFDRMCGQGVFSAGPTYVNPHVEQDKLRILEINYPAVTEYELVNSATFKFYTWMMLVLWLFTLNKELGSVAVMAEFVLRFPAVRVRLLTSDPFPAASSPASSSTDGHSSFWRLRQGKHLTRPLIPKDAVVHIRSISSPHRAVCCCILGVRLLTLFYMLVVGIIYATCTNNYLDLLLNTVALAFVFELPNMFHQWLLPQSIKEQLDRVEIAEFREPGKQNMVGNLVRSTLFLGLVVIPLVCFVIVEINDVTRTEPMLEVMQCACGQVGDRCKVGWHLRREWWSVYWENMKALSR